MNAAFRTARTAKHVPFAGRAHPGLFGDVGADFLRAELLQDGQTATQVFTYDKDILTIGLEFYLPGDQPCGALDVVLYDADTGVVKRVTCG